MNKVLLVGHASKDSEVRKLDGFSVTEFSIATDAGYWDKNNKTWIEGVDFHSVKIFSEREVQKGDLIEIEGSLKTDSWDDNGERRYRTYVKASRLNILRKKNPLVNTDINQPEEVIPGDDLPF